MGTRIITTCDGCGRELKTTSEKYCNLDVSTNRYSDAAGSMDYNSVRVVFCEECVKERLLPTLEKLVALEQAAVRR